MCLFSSAACAYVHGNTALQIKTKVENYAASKRKSSHMRKFSKNILKPWITASVLIIRAAFMCLDHAVWQAKLRIWTYC